MILIGLSHQQTYNINAHSKCLGRLLMGIFLNENSMHNIYLLLHRQLVALELLGGFCGAYVFVNVLILLQSHLAALLLQIPVQPL